MKFTDAFATLVLRSFQPVVLAYRLNIEQLHSSNEYTDWHHGDTMRTITTILAVALLAACGSTDTEPNTTTVTPVEGIAVEPPATLSFDRPVYVSEHAGGCEGDALTRHGPVSEYTTTSPDTACVLVHCFEECGPVSVQVR